MSDIIIIDDDDVNNLILEKLIKYTIRNSKVHTFREPENGLQYILTEFSDNLEKTGELFLDLNIPKLSGWEVLDRIDKFPDFVKNRIRIFILSSSVYPKDKEKAQGNPLVFDYITKPMSRPILKRLFHL